MRREREVPGGACSSGVGLGASRHSTTVKGRIASALTGRATAGTTGSAFTKFRSTCVPQFFDGCLVRWQHPWAGCLDVKESKTCGQEKQFPQNNAATTSAAMIELERARI